MGSINQTVLTLDGGRRGSDLYPDSHALMVQAGFRVLRGGVRNAVCLAAGHRPDLIVVPVRAVPDDARVLVRTLRRHPATTSISILLLGASLDEKVLAALREGADDYLQVPFQAADFRLRAELAIRLRRAGERGRHADALLERQVETMKFMQRFYHDVLAADGVEATCRRSAEAAARLMDSRRVSVLLADTRTHSLRFAHAVGMDPALWRDRRVPLSSPVAGRVLATRREIVVNHDTSWPRREGYHRSQFISVPLIRGGPGGQGPVLGVLNVTERRNGLDYEPQDVLALSRLAGTAAFSIDAVRTRRKLDETRDSIILSLARLSEYRHKPTGRHLERVRELSVLLARYLADDPRTGSCIDQQFLDDLRRAAPLHDVGKVAMPDQILTKKGRLSPEEFASMRRHPEIGAATLRSVMAAGHEDSFVNMAVDIAHCHHERYDGRGYPRGLTGEDIPLSARIVCLADSYDAIRTVREYKPARTHAEATRELLIGSGTQFDPIVVQAFCALEDQFERIYNNLMEYEHGMQKAPAVLLPAGV